MIGRIVIITSLGVLLSGCFIAPIAFIGPAASGFSTASIIQSGVTTTANYMIKKSTGKTIAEHALNSLNKEIYQQAYFPKEIKEIKEKSKISDDTPKVR